MARALAPRGCCHLLVLLALLLTPCCVQCERSSLYSEGDHVTQLNFDDLRSTVYGEGSSGPRVNWLIQVFHAYCGHCINYSKGFKTIALKLWPWRHTLRIGVINIADVANFDVMAHYGFGGVPTLFFVSARCTWTEKYTAVLVSKRSRLIPAELLDLMEPYVKQLAPLPSNSPLGQCKFLLEEAAPGPLSRHVIMDTLPQIRVCWRKPSAPPPSGTVLVRKVSPSGEVAPAPFGTAEDLQDLRGLLNWRPASSDGDSHEPSSDTTPAAVQAASDGPRPPSLQDLLSAMDRAIISDAPLAGLHRARVWRAVRRFVRLSAALAPPNLWPHVSRLAEAMGTEPPSAADAVATWKRMLKKAGFPIGPRDQWTACMGSKPYLRGYPCGLWQLFHTLTALRLKANSSKNSVAKVMRGFIVHVFSCSRCAKNFARESASAARLKEPMKPRDELLWLWRLHNRVNDRLKEQPSEDPEFPKVQFPSEDVCPSCASNENSRVEFLLQWYTGWM